jgi:aspartyl-tRNA(Asn)/glutamyl-tRNA(Gln) amidotransferase subunit C
LQFFDNTSGNDMSLSHTQQTTGLDTRTVQGIAHLARLSLTEAQATEYAESLNKILHLMDALATFDTEGIEPLKSPFDHPQPLRADIVSESNHRDEYQAVAPATEAGLYLVPRVIE